MSAYRPDRQRRFSSRPERPEGRSRALRGKRFESSFESARGAAYGRDNTLSSIRNRYEERQRHKSSHKAEGPVVRTSLVYRNKSKRAGRPSKRDLNIRRLRRNVAERAAADKAARNTPKFPEQQTKAPEPSAGRTGAPKAQPRKGTHKAALRRNLRRSIARAQGAAKSAATAAAAGPGGEVSEQEGEAAANVAALREGSYAAASAGRAVKSGAARATRPARERIMRGVRARWMDVRQIPKRLARHRIRLKPQRTKAALEALSRPVSKTLAITKAVRRAGRRAVSPFAAIAKKLAVFFAPLAIVLVLIPIALFAAGSLIAVPILSSTDTAKHMSIDGLPEWITSDILLEVLRCQEEYGHPAGATIAQIIAESGASTPSMLASRDHNLFGMKWDSSFLGCPEVTNYANWKTQEEYEPGVYTTITDSFVAFKSNVDCVRFRSRVFLQMDHYAKNPFIMESIEKRSSDLFCVGLKDAGWATAVDYVEFMQSILDSFDLRKFDHMTVEDLMRILEGGSAVIGTVSDGPITSRQAAVIANATAARTPSTGRGYCAGWVSNVFVNAGVGSYWGNACDMYWAYCHSADLNELKPGMIVAVNTEPYSSAAILYGHVGIYVGDGMVAQNVSGNVGYQELHSWIDEFGVTAQVRWGWLGDNDLSK